MIEQVADLLAPGGTPATGGGSDGAPWPLFVIPPIAILIGITLAIKPELQWKMNRWQYKNPDALKPSAKGLIMVRITGTFIAVIGVVLLVVAFTKS